ncbi:hypothetical protein ACBJ59_60370 [Nonomuraea sp. MTCD27]|uniref:hypothetical protein n=1 Tax=Nonomuraea sp. MTCD27 TaxID=1676747 RepID=UPI0035C00144
MDDDLLEAARTVRPYLPDLIGDAAPQVDQEICRLLDAARAGADVAFELNATLSQTMALHLWKEEVLADELHRPPELQSRTVRRSAGRPSPGDGEDIDATKYVCPVERDYIWWRQSPGDQVKLCPDHEVPLVRADGR